jgi:hypothetical protein
MADHAEPLAEEVRQGVHLGQRAGRFLRPLVVPQGRLDGAQCSARIDGSSQSSGQNEGAP